VQQFLLGKYRADDEPPADGDTTLFP